MSLPLSEHLPLIALAPDGIQKLRGLILELAVRGKLVPQDTKAEPAGDLLESVRHSISSARLKSKVFDAIADQETRYTIPQTWAWARLGSLFNIVYGKGLPTSNLTDEGYDVFGANGIIGKYSSYLYEEPQLLISCRGAYSGKANISPSKCFVTSNSLVLECSWDRLSQRYFYYALSIADKSKIVTGSAQPQVTTTNLDPFIIPVPPLEEQYRIVAKVDELMALCDRLESEQNDSAAAHEQLVETLLGSLTQSTDAAHFEANWKLVAEHFDTLFTTEASIDALQKTILQLAMMGKLVPQDPNDKPASKIFASDKKFETALPYEIPHGWTLTNLNNVAEINGGFAFKSTDYTNDGMRVVRISDFDEQGFKDHKIVRHSFSQELSRFCLAEDNILMAMTGGTVGKSLLVKALPEPMIVNQRVATIKVLEGTCATYVDIVIRAEGVQAAIQKAKNSTNDNISMNDIKGFAVPLPPLEEQFRIVAKVDEIMVLCDSLKNQLTESRKKEDCLADTLIQASLKAA